MRAEYITLETAKKIEELKMKRRAGENKVTNKMNSSIIDANIKLQDENKMLKSDNKLLEKRMNNATEYLKEEMNKFKMFDLEDIIQDAIDMLEGNYVYEEDRRRKKWVN